MPAEARGRCLALLLLLIPAIAAQGIPSIHTLNTSTDSATSNCGVPCRIDVSSQADNLSDAAYGGLGGIGREILSPPSEASAHPGLAGGTRHLPAVPAGVFMVLAGFLCVSFVNDRKVWLASLAGILWLGQTGLAAIPQAASHIMSRRSAAEHSSDSGMVTGRAEGRDRLRSDVEGTQYIALLRHLAGIPALISCSIPTSFSSLRTKHSPVRVPGNKAVCKYFGQPPGCAIAGYASNQTSPRAWSAGAAEHAVRFSPGFVFSNLARGPPPFD
ncbi:MAG: hypothetical protein ACYS8Z_11455 [Planctomycetota bacterium]|jgi:hypothetical protein